MLLGFETLNLKIRRLKLWKLTACKHVYVRGGRLSFGVAVPPVSVRRFPSFWTQPLENLSIDSATNGFLSNPAPGKNLVSGNLVMETGCTLCGAEVVVLDCLSVVGDSKDTD